MTKVKIWNQQNFVDRPRNPRVFSMQSQTLPDESMSIRHIMTRYASTGVGPAIGKDPIFDEEELSSGIDVKSLDLVDLQELAMKARDLRSSAEREIAKKKKDAYELAQRQYREKVREEVREEVRRKKEAADNPE